MTKKNIKNRQVLNEWSHSDQKDYAIPTTCLEPKSKNKAGAINNNMNGDAVDKFLRRFTSKQTKKGYRSALNRFFRAIGVTDPNNYIKTSRDFKDDVEVFAEALSDVPPKTFTTYLGVVRKFLQRFDIILPDYFWKDLKTYSKYKRLKKALTQDRIPTVKEMKRILNHADIRQKALYLTLISSGMRIGEVTKIKISDVDFEFKYDGDKTITKIRLLPEYTKTGEPRTCFISDEASECLKEWLNHREEFIIYSNKILNLPNVDKKEVDDRTFPFTPNSARLCFIRILDKIGLNEKDKHTDRYLIHIHVLRKYFKTHMSIACQADIVEKLMGHEGYLSDAYDRYTDQDLAKLYKKAMYTVTVVSEKDFTEELEAMKEELAHQKEMLDKTKWHEPGVVDQKTYTEMFKKEYERLKKEGKL